MMKMMTPDGLDKNIENHKDEENTLETVSVCEESATGLFDCDDEMVKESGVEGDTISRTKSSDDTTVPKQHQQQSTGVVTVVCISLGVAVAIVAAITLLAVFVSGTKCEFPGEMDNNNNNNNNNTETTTAEP